MALAQVGGVTYSNLAVAATKIDTSLVGSFLVFNFVCFNPSDATAYVQFFDLPAASVTVGATTPYFVLPLPAGGGIDTSLVAPKAFHNGITFAATTTSAGAVAPSENCIVQFDYVGG